MADPDVDLLDDHVSIRRTMDYLGKEQLMAKNAYEEARRDGYLVLAERERRVYKYYLAMIEAETNIHGAKVLADSVEVRVDTWDSLFKRFLLQFRLGPGGDDYTM